MRGFRQFSIRSKLLALIMAVTSVALVLASAAFLFYDAYMFRQSLIHEYETVASVLGSNSTASLTFHDPESAHDILSSLRAEAELRVVSACIYTPAGLVFATYHRDSAGPACSPTAPQGEGSHIERGQLFVVQPILLKGDRIGTLVIQRDLTDVRQRLYNYLVFLAIIVIGTLGVATLLSRRLQRAISEPIRHLASTTLRVSVEKDYSLRVAKGSEDELGVLIDGFNQMLAQIQQRDAALSASHQQLEQRVQQRTQELQLEINERRNAEQKLAERTAYLNALIENSPLAIVTLNQDHRIQMVNPAFEKLFQYQSAEVLGRDLDRLVASGKTHEEAARLTRLGMSGQTVLTTARRQRKDGSLVDVEIHAMSLILKDEVIGAFALYQDITERKRVEAELSKLSSAVQQIADSLMITSKDGAIEYVNPAFEKHTGYAKEEIIGQTPRVLKSGEHNEAFYQVLWKTILSGDVFRAVFINRKKSGELYHEEKTITPLRDSQGNITHFVSSGRDITERKRAEEALAQAEEKYRTIFENAVVGIFQTTPDGQYLTANPTLASILGYSSPQELMAALADLNHQFYVEPGRRAEFVRLMQEQGAVSTFESEVYRKDGSVIWISEDARLLHGADGRALGFEGTTVDITQRRQAEEALRQSEAQKSAIMESALDAIITIDAESRVTEFNLAAEKIFGFSREQALGRTLSELVISPSLREAHRRGLAHFLATGEGPVLGKRIELSAMRADGSEFPIELSVTCVRTKDQPIFTAFLRDLTEQRRIERGRKAQYAVTRVLADSATLAEAAPKVLQAICEVVGWQVGGLWVRDAQAGLLRCVDVWHQPGAEVGEFEQVSRQITFAPGVGLPGRVLESREPAWIADLACDSNFLRAAVASREGLHGAFAFPILFQNEVIGVVEFFSQEVRKPDDDLLSMIRALGSQIGQFIARKQA